MKRFVLAVLLVTTALSSRGDQGVNQKKGFNSDNVYFSHDIDAINAFNGNLTVTIPLGQRYPLAEGFSYGLTAVSNANVWEPENLYDPPDFTTDSRGVGTEAEGLCNSEDGVMFAHPHRRANAGIGWIVTLGRLLDPDAPTGEPVTDWIYESPDGADHKFWSTGVSGVSVTRDGTYLRMIYNAATNTRTVEFPDGIKHTFGPTSMGGPWLPKRIENRFGAFLQVDYKGPADSTAGDVIPQGTYEWRLSDSHGRHHVVKFVKRAWEGSGRYLVDSIELQGFNNTIAKYRFYYTARTIGRVDWAERCPGYFVNAAIQTLDRIEFPDDPSTSDEGVTNYSFVYDNGIDWIGTSGLLQEATLPTGGRIVWSYGQYAQSRFSSAAPSPWIDLSWGVIKRELKPPVGGTGVVPTWTYTYNINADYDPDTVGDNDEPVHQGRSLMIDPVGNKTVSFFSVNTWDYGLDYFWSEYGKPFTRQYSDGGMYLSEVQYPPSVNVNLDAPLTGALRAKYVKYEADIAPNHGEPGDDNWRLKSTRTKSFHTDGTTEWVDSISSDWDGFGHYRVSETSGSTTTKKKISRTNYNPHLTPTTIIPTTQPWILDTYSWTEVEYDGEVARTEVCHDKVNSYPTTGFVTRKRMLRGGSDPRKDLLTVYTPSSEGNVATEQFFGGDIDLLPAGTFDTCTTWPGTPRYSITHTSSGGVRAQSQYSGVSFKSQDLTIDASGLTRISRDSALAATTYEYNPAGQLRKIIPDGEAWTEYRYNVTPGATPPATVIVKQWPSTNLNPSSGATPLTETRYSYDAHGRLVQQANWVGGMMAGASGATRWAVMSNTYDLLGRKWKTTVPVSLSSGAFATFTAPDTVTTYDALGRVITVKQPDNSTTVTAYPKASVLTRTNQVQSRNASGGDVVIAATTQEQYDPFGRLIAVTEAVGRPEAAATTYEYDEGDRLVHVIAGVQDRYFHYDDAGLLTSEEHPESGITSYLYDSGRNVKQLTTPNATVISNYDAAARVSSITHNGNVLKSFTYDTGVMGLGKVRTATRVNDHGAVGKYTVTETFTYAATTGRLKSKATEVVKVRNSVVESTTTFADEYAYDELGANTSVTYPQCLNGCGSFGGPARVITNEFSQGLLKRVPGYTGDFTYHPNGLIADFSRVNVGGGTGPRYQQTVGADGLPRPSSIDVTGYCTNLAITTPPVASKTVNFGDPAGLSVVATGATSYQWYEVGSTTVLATGTSLNVSVNQTTSYFVRVLNGTCSIDSDVSVVTVSAPVPTVTTGAATSVTANSATLNGTVNPNGYSSTTAFEYGTTQAYGNTAPAQTRTGSTVQSISASISGLTCGTTYHFRAKANNAGGAGYGANATFTTSACAPPTSAPTVTTGTPTNVGQTSVTFNGTVNPNGSSATSAFDYGPTTSYGSSVAGQTRTGSTTQSISASVSGLSCGTTYHVRARATNAGGTGSGIDRQFSTAACPSACTAEPIAYGSSLSRTLTASSCTSGYAGANHYTGVFSFTGAAGDVVTIDMVAPPGGIDPFLYLLAPNGEMVAYNDDSHSTLNSQVNYRLWTSGTWTIHATTFHQFSTGDYELSLDKCGAEPITAPVTLTRTLSGDSCAQTLRGWGHFGDRYLVDGEAGRTLVIDMTSSFDTYLFLIDPFGNLVVSNDDYNGTYNSHIAYVIPTTGVYEIQATTYGEGVTGTYQLAVDQPSCSQPDATIDAPSSMCASAVETASAPLASSYAWYIQNGTITSSSSTRTINFRATGSQPVTLTVVVTASCGTTSSDTAQVTVANPTATVSGNHQIQQGQSQEIVAALTGTGPWTVVWSPGNTTQNVAVSPARLTVQPGVTTHYTISQVTDSTGCSAVGTGEAIVTVAPPAPTQVSATATTATSVQITWAFSGSADHYLVDRCASACSSASSWLELGTSTQLLYLDTTALANKSYLYRARASKGGTSSAPSNTDVATTIVFGSDVIAGTYVDDGAILQLRTAVQAMATLAGTAPPTLTGTTLFDTYVLTVHLSELRSSLATARSALGLPAVVYSSPSEAIRALDINELRGGVR